LEEIEKANINFIFMDISFEINDVDLLDIHDLEIVYQLIPSNTKDKIHLDIYNKTLPLIASELLKNRRSYENDRGYDSDMYTLRHQIFKSFSYFILQREKNEIDRFLKPFIDSFTSTEEAALFIERLISAEDYLNCYEQFWYIWRSLYPKVKELCDSPHNYYLGNVIINYLLAWRRWSDDAIEWHSLKTENLSFYVRVSREIGHIPSVLYSISKILNSIGTSFNSEGIDWIYLIISKNSSLNLAELESDTLCYLEKFLRKYVYNSRQKIKKEIKLKNKIIPILDFMIERGSIHGYLLRENIL